MKSFHILPLPAARFLARPLTLAALALGASAMQLDPPVLLPGDTAPVVAPGVQAAAAMARGGNQYLVVWEDSRTDGTGSVSTGGWGPGPSDIFAMRLDAAGQPIDLVPIVVSMRPFNQTRTNVAWNGSNWLVVWESQRITQYSTTRGIYAARVSPSGAVLDDPPIVIDDTDDVDEYFPVVASDGTNWAVLWDDYDRTTSLLTVNSAIVDPSGLVLQKRVLASNSVGFMLPTNVRIAFAGGRYLMTSEHYRSGGFTWDIFGRLFDTGLNPLGPEFLIDGSGSDSVQSWVAGNGAGFYVTWSTSGSWQYAYGTPVALDGTVAFPGGVELHSFGQVGSSPYVDWDGARWLVTYEGWSTSGSALFGVHVDTSGQPAPEFTIVAPVSVAGALITKLLLLVLKVPARLTAVVSP